MSEIEEPQIVRDGLSRDEFTEERVMNLRKELTQLGSGFILSEEERNQARHRFLSAHDHDKDLWVFGYGSLMWNPAFHYQEMLPVRIYGYHRRFCLSAPIGRGTPERPGLMLGLDRGGSCRGIAIRIAAADIESETEILWRREMISGAYKPVWLKGHCGTKETRMMTFVINEDHERYTGWLAHRDMVMAIATASGKLGRCRDYLYNTVLHMRELGLKDSPMERLLAEVDRYRA